MRDQNPLLVNLSLLTVAQVVAQLLNFVALVYLARYLGDYWFGLVQVGVAVSAYAMISAEWGLNSLGIKEISRLEAPAEVLAYARTHQGVLVGLAVIVFGCGLAVLPLFRFYQHDHLLFIFYVALVIPQVASLEWLGIGLERMAHVGLAKALASLLYTGMVVGLLVHLDGVWGWPNYRWVPLMYLLAFFLGNLVVIFPAWRWLGGIVYPRLPSATEGSRRLRETAPIGASIVVMRVLMNGDIIMLGILSRPDIAGQYAAPAKIGFLMVIAMEVLWKAMLPRLSRLAGQSKEAFVTNFQLYFGIVAACLLPVAVVGSFGGPELILLVFGQDYAAGGPIFRVLIFSYTLFSLAWFLGNSLIATDRQKDFFLPLLFSAAVAVTGNLILVPRLDGLGAALGMLASHTVLLVVMVVICRSWFRQAIRQALGFILGGLAAMIAVILVFSFWPLMVRLGLGLLAYALVCGLPMKNWIPKVRA